MTRRSVLGLGLTATTLALAGCRGPGSPAPSGGPGTPGSSTSAAPAVRAAAPSSDPGPSRPDGPSPAAALTTVLTRYLRPTGENPRHPTYAGAVALALADGRPGAHVAVGEALRYGAGPVLLPAGQRVRMRPDSIFDLASITKVFTAILALQQADRGRIDLDAPVVRYLPGFTGAGKSRITVAMLLTHTSGLPVGATVTGSSTLAGRWAAVLATPLVKGALPGTVVRYSSVGLMVLGKLVEKVTGQRLDHALRTGLTEPLGLRWTGFRPHDRIGAAERAARLVATDARSSRGLLRGVVHDDVANHLGGIAGHAGIFSTAEELGVVGQLLLGGGTYGGTRILAESTVHRMVRNANSGLPAVDTAHPGRSSAHGLGVVLDQPWFMGRLAGPATFGHTGFTGTSMVVDPTRRLVLVLLTNRAHPNWSWADPDPARVAAANVLAAER
ncbi:serine hydrolase domain-containing protein [Micromonospora coerulea]|uniref:serine hydrolase domain-containing protein n=1 Tax=Micromonospora coerulea TaxID=47856 RepID=UPI001903B0EF|nr:serine hydrolase domain-containing protein [Micromonospora veneta]